VEKGITEVHLPCIVLDPMGVVSHASNQLTYPYSSKVSGLVKGVPLDRCVANYRYLNCPVGVIF